MHALTDEIVESVSPSVIYIMHQEICTIKKETHKIEVVFKIVNVCL